MAAAATIAPRKEPQFVRSCIVTAISTQLEEDNPPEVIGCWTPASKLRDIAAGRAKEAELYDGAFVPELIVSFQWWIETAEALLPFDQPEFPLDALSYRDRLIALEFAFWEAVAPARRQSAWYLSKGDQHAEEPARELIRSYLGYRDNVCAYAREVLPESLWERLEERI